MKELTFAPIVLFAYAREALLRQTVEALAANPEAADSDLYVYCDGPKGEADRARTGEVRKYADSITGFKSVTRVYREANMGLARSVIAGVTEVLADRGSAIVVEDDLVTSPHFLRYMNDGLSLYRDNPQVASIHAYCYPATEAMPETFFLRGADCWGWATWSRAWDHFDADGAALLARLRAQGMTRAFDLDDAYPYTRMLEDQVAGRNNSWAVRWHASCFLANMLTLYPGRSLVANIGTDGSGTHCAPTDEYDVVLSSQPVNVRPIALEESVPAREQVRQFFGRERAASRDRAGRLWARVRNLLGACKPMVRDVLRKAFSLEASLAAAWARGAYRRLMWAQWSIGGVSEHFDHRIEQYFHWPATGSPLWLERGMFSRFALKGADVLELTCGNGFNTRHFYAFGSRRVLACDYDPAAIDAARRDNPAPNVEYVVADLRQGVPSGSFDNVIWDFGFSIAQYFTEAQADRIFSEVKQRLTPQGIFSGYTAIEPRHATGSDHKYRFGGASELEQLLQGQYRNVRVLATVYPERVNLYFWASEGPLPLGTAP